MKTVMIAALAFVLYGCSADGRKVGNLFDPLCAPDGSVVKYQLPNSSGSFEGGLASKENCPWNQ